MAAVSSDQVTAAEKSAQLMSATGGAPAGVGSEYVIEPPSTLAAEESDGSDAEEDDDMPMDSQVCSMSQQSCVFNVPTARYVQTSNSLKWTDPCPNVTEIPAAMFVVC